MIPADPAALVSAPLFLDAGGPLPNLLVTLLVIAVVILVARFVLNLAWRLVKLAALVIGGLWVISVVLDLAVPLPL